MIESGRGDPEASPLCLPVHVSYRVDPKISIQGAGQRGRRVSEDQDGRGEEAVPGDRVRGTKYPAGPHPHGDQFSSQIQHRQGGPGHQTKHGEGAVGEVRIHTGTILQTWGDVVGWIFRKHSGLGRTDDTAIREVPGKRRLRTSEACIGLNAPDVSPGLFTQN